MLLIVPRPARRRAILRAVTPLLDRDALICGSDRLTIHHDAGERALRALRHLGFTDYDSGSSRVVVYSLALPWVVKIAVADWAVDAIETEEETFARLRELAPSRVPHTFWLSPLVCLQERLDVNEDRTEPLLCAIREELGSCGIWLNDHEPYQYGWRGDEWVLLDGGDTMVEGLLIGRSA